MGASGPTGYLGPLPSECRYGRKSDTPNESMAISGAREASTTANDSGVSTGLTTLLSSTNANPAGQGAHGHPSTLAPPQQHAVQIAGIFTSRQYT
ncbi:hypothetical protein CBS63078_2766 [Aspergillus niger]|nr:hypothetical protein CBS63078_2766 [Aspergillus niger]KAI3034276.1 hypothetical protein CBS147345_640 [Aspergillus niger]KAI3076456.1 hypothetical protein CBS147353_4782 [Aspergillus niger]